MCGHGQPTNYEQGSLSRRKHVRNTDEGENEQVGGSERSRHVEVSCITLITGH
jgi:hypothetical protein